MAVYGVEAIRRLACSIPERVEQIKGGAEP